METIIINILNTFKIPGIILAILYSIFNQKFISIYKSSEIERLFFSHEKKFIYKLSSYIIMVIVVFFLMSIVSISFLNLVQNHDILLSFKASLIAYIIFGIITIISIIFNVLEFINTTNNKQNKVSNNMFTNTAAKIQNKITSNMLISILLILVYFLLTLAFFSYFSSTSINKNFSENKEGYIVISSLIHSLLIPKILLFLVRPYVSKNKKHYYIETDNQEWFLLKPFNDSEIIVGDKPLEENCNKIKFIGFEELKKSPLYIVVESELENESQTNAST